MFWGTCNSYDTFSDQHDIHARILRVTRLVTGHRSEDNILPVDVAEPERKKTIKMTNQITGWHHRTLMIVVYVVHDGLYIHPVERDPDIPMPFFIFD